MKTLILLLSVLVTGLSCSKNSGEEKDTLLPVIVLSNPTAGQTFTSGQSIQISGNITDNKFIAEIHIHVTNTNTGTLLMDVHLYPNGSTATFNQAITAIAGVNYKIQVIAKDRAVNEGRSSVEVSCN
jgi:Bacterial Ig domain